MDIRQMMTCLPTETFSMERVRYFARQLITPDDLTLEQEYFRNKLRRHNRFLHGWGVVCGCMVKPANEDWTVVITPGYIMGPYGDEILIDREVEVNLLKEGLDGLAVSPCAEQLDPWCSEVEVAREAGEPLYVAVKYAECKSRPVRVHVGCGCDETHCEYSRIRDSYAVKVLTECPESHKKTPEPNQPNMNELVTGAVPDCPECPSDPWVVLAKVVPGPNGEIQRSSISNCDFGGGYYRRMVVAFGDFWWHCTEPSPPTATVRIDPPSEEVAPDTEFEMRVIIEDATDLGGYEFHLSFDPTILEAEGIDDGGFLESTGRTICSLGEDKEDIDDHTRQLYLRAVTWGSALGPTGTGVLGIVNFKTVTAGETILQLSDAKIYDSHANEFTVIVQGAEVTVT